MPKIPEQTLASNSILRRSADALMRHEEGHLDFPVQAAYRLEHEIKKMEDQFRTCAELGNFINDVGNRFLREAQQRERQFDLDTKHGTVDGANF